MSRGLGNLQRTLLAILAPPGPEGLKHGWRPTRSTAELVVHATDNPPPDEVIIVCDPQSPYPNADVIICDPRESKTLAAAKAAMQRALRKVEARCVSGTPSESNLKNVLRALHALADKGLLVRNRDRDDTFSWALPQRQPERKADKALEFRILDAESGEPLTDWLPSWRPSPANGVSEQRTYRFKYRCKGEPTYRDDSPDQEELDLERMA